MLSADRQRIIIDQLYQNGSVRVSDMSRQLGVHEETIRRDLKALAQKWEIDIVYGGAVLKNQITSPSVQEINMQMKRSENYEEKQLVARKAAALIEPGETIGINSGSTVEYILDYLEEMDVDTEFDSAEYRIDLYFNPSDMPIQTISIRGSGFRMTRRPISGAPTLDPATFVLRSRYNLNASFDIYPTEDFLPSLYFTFNSYNEARLKDVYFVFNYNMNFTPDYFRFSLGIYYFYHDFEDSMIRLAVGNV